MAAFQKIALAGATGNLGPAILNNLVAAGFSVTALTRDAKKNTFPNGVKAVEVDYESIQSLTSAFRGHDVVVSTLGPEMLNVQHHLIDAAIAAGVPRFVPSDFGSDTSNPKTRALPFYAYKNQTEEYMLKKAKEGALIYTSIRCGPFLDWCIMVGLIMNVKERKVELFDGGDRPFSSSTLDTVGKALAAALKMPTESKNRIYYVQDAVVTQNQLIKYGKELTGQDFKVEHSDTAKIEKASYEGFEKGDMGPGVMYGFLKRAIWGEGYGGEFEKVDNAELGIPEMSDKQLKDVVARYA